MRYFHWSKIIATYLISYLCVLVYGKNDGWKWDEIRQIVISDFLADSLAINGIKELQCFSVSINFPLGKIGINHWLFAQARQYIFFPCVINKGEKIQSAVLSPKDNPLNFYTLGKKHHFKTWSPNSKVQWVLSLGGKIKIFPLVEGWA